MTTVITICDTCKREGWDAQQQSHSDGEAFAALVEHAAKGCENIRTRRHSCLMGCQRSCNLAIQAEGKLTYVLGEFEPTQEAANGVVDYALLHYQSETGQVPFRSWPQAIKGHFVSRLPVLPQD